ncbi:41416_t:CDS:2 [Gigaspora margarita]|uniref:41416_t:CDS:1 n=1 Tax=Gigaspora margarita TaxID=4874 RepID=A0ABN7UNY3_GIGMA|nr:41416_t:CDS:2 [Gigaspora margarita]
MAREFATTFASNSLIISQDDKAKISLGMPAVGRTFKSIQSLNKPVTISDYDFLCRTKQKLIPLVYFIINHENINEMLRQEYFARTSSLSHMRDLIDISKYDDFVSILNNDDHLKSIWILLLAGIELPVDEFEEAVLNKVKIKLGQITDQELNYK